jgi:hypothetical protein
VRNELSEEEQRQKSQQRVGFEAVQHKVYRNVRDERLPRVISKIACSVRADEDGLREMGEIATIFRTFSREPLASAMPR